MYSTVSLLEVKINVGFKKPFTSVRHVHVKCRPAMSLQIHGRVHDSIFKCCDLHIKRPHAVTAALSQPLLSFAHFC
jgi:hypothetical protein